MSDMLPRRDAVLGLLAGRARPLTTREMAARLEVSESAYPGFVRFIESLAQEGALRPLDHERFALEAPPLSWRARRDPQEREGVLSVDPRGFGFVRTPGRDDDLYIPEHSTGGALHGDRVLARAVRRGVQGPEGEVLRVIARGSHRVAGTLRRRGASSWIEPDDARVRGPIVLRGDIHGREGDAAVGLITRFPELPDENPEGTLVAALGPPGTLRVEEAKILVREGVEEAHPPEAAAEALRAAAEPLAGEREDLTHLPLPTIDPDDARDHDDAIWVERADDGSYTAWIAIADVSHYVRPGTALDDAARDRGCSIYLPDRAIPMLPPALSSDACSLLPGVPRPCLCAIVRLGPGADVLDVRLVEGLMRSRAKLTYGGVARALGWTTRPAPQPAADELAPGLRAADQLAQILRTRRLRRGALDFQLPEPKVTLHEGLPSAIERRADDPGERRAYQLVEELMLLANEVVAKFLVDRGLMGIFRVHGPPDEQKLERFVRLCEEAGVPLEIDDALDPKKLSQHLRKLARHPRADVLNSLLLRAMKQASYDVVNTGHFGLASTAYVHFTSPIRRYPDLTVHRVVKAALAAERRGKSLAQSGADEQKLGEDAVVASERERRAMAIEREVLDLYRAFFMRDHIGESFEGAVTGVVGGGAFVTLDGPFVDVLVRADAMGKDTYELDDEQLRFFGHDSGDSVGLGDRVSVTVEDVALLRRLVYAFRHPPDTADRAPLRHAPFRPLDQPLKTRRSRDERRAEPAPKHPDRKRSPQPPDRRAEPSHKHPDRRGADQRQPDRAAPERGARPGADRRADDRRNEGKGDRRHEGKNDRHHGGRPRKGATAKRGRR